MSPGTWESAIRSAGGATFAVDEVMGRQGRQRLRRHPPARTSRRSRDADGLLFLQQRRGRGASRPEGARRRACRDRRFRRPPRQRHAGHLLGRPSVMYASTHEMPSYPGTGALDERGEHNQIVNAPLRAGDGSDIFREAFEVAILPRIEAFRPDLVIISAGFDAHFRDPLGNLKSARGRFRLGDPQADARRPTLLRRSRRLAARRRLRSRGSWRARWPLTYRR